MREAKLVKEVKDWIAAHGGKVFKVHGSVFSEAGIPDLVGCLKGGRCVVIECKAPGKKPTPIQVHQVQEFAKCGAVSIIGDDFEKIKKVLMGATYGI